MNKFIRRNLAILIFATVISKSFGFIREIAIAYSFGVSSDFDLLLAIFVIPNMVVSLLLYSMSNSVIPRLKIKNSDSTETFVETFFWPYLFLLIFIVIAYYISSRIYGHFFFNEYSIYNSLILLFSIFLFFGSLFGIMKSYYDAQERFILPAFSPLVIHISTIFCILIFAKSYGVLSFAIGLSFGVFLQMLLFILDLFFTEKLKQFRFSVNLKKLPITSILIVIVIELIGQSYTLIDRSFISLLPTGHLSALYYAGVINNLPVTILALTSATVFFPKITMVVQENRIKILIKLLKRISVLSIFITIPIVLIYYIFGNEIIKLLFERGEFDANASLITSEYLKNFSLGLPFIFLFTILSKVCYAFKKEKYVLYGVLIAISFKIIMNFVFVNKTYFYGMSLSTSFSFLICSTVIYILINRLIKNKLNEQ